MALFYYIIDVLGYKKWAFFFKVVGMNSILIYLSGHFINWEYANNGFFQWLGQLTPLLVCSGGDVNLLCGRKMGVSLLSLSSESISKGLIRLSKLLFMKKIHLLTLFFLFLQGIHAQSSPPAFIRDSMDAYIQQRA